MVIDTFVRDIQVVRRSNVVVHLNLNMSPEGHDMGEFFVFKSQGNGLDL